MNWQAIILMVIGALAVGSLLGVALAEVTFRLMERKERDR